MLKSLRGFNKRRVAMIAVVFLSLFVGVGQAIDRQDTPGQGGAPVAIENVTIIDTTANKRAAAYVAPRTVLISGGRITRVGPVGAVTVPEGATRIDGTGRFLIPGLWDMHVHLNRDRASQVEVMLPLMVANGVTGVRDMLSDCWEPCAPGRLDLDDMRALRQEIDDGAITGPRVLGLSSPIVSGHRGNPSSGDPETWKPFFRPHTAEQAGEVVRYLSERGVDFIKIYNGLPRPAFFALMKEAGRLGIEVTGHLPWSVSPVEASEAGMRAIEHARFPALACGPDYEGFRAAFSPFAELETDEFPEQEFQSLKESAIAKFDERKCKKILKTLARNETYLVPTHTTREMDALANDPEYRADPRRKYIPPWRIKSWDRDLDATADGPPELLQFYKEFFDLGLRVTGIAHRVGVTILAGTDTLDTQCFPGFSLHDELEHLVRAGLTPLDAIKSATVHPARFLGRVAEFGSVAEGKRADLVILNADPLLEIANTRAIHAVVLDGVVHRRDELDRMLDGVEAFVVSVTPLQRTIVKVDPAIYDSYVGEYEFAGFTLTVTRDGEKLMVQSPGQPPVEIYPESETEFFIKVVDAQITFVKGKDGQAHEILLRQRGQELSGRRK